MTIRMLIADDALDYLALLEVLLEPITEIEVVAKADNGAEAVRIAASQHIDAALLDVDMPGLDGFEAAAAIRRVSPQTTVALQTGRLEADVLARAAELGVAVRGKVDLVKDLDLLARPHSERKAA